MSTARTFDTVLLLALPASGKSEVRKYLAHLNPELCARDFHMGPTVQLDDYPYVHTMRCIDDALRAEAAAPIFFQAADKPFADGRDWGTLVHLVNEDYADLVAKRRIEVAAAGTWLLDRIDAARRQVGAVPTAEQLTPEVRLAVAKRIEKDARSLLTDKLAGYPDDLDGKTVVIELARGGQDGAAMPLPAPHGYAYSLPLLAPAILAHAVVLYIWVTPEESRRKNEARADPNNPGSILHHGVPIDVMLGDYGCDDMSYLIEQSDQPNTLRLQTHGRTYHVPVARFDNRHDKTSFVRGEVAQWDEADVAALHDELQRAMETLIG